MEKIPVPQIDLEVFLIALEEKRLTIVEESIRDNHCTDSDLAKFVLWGQAIESVRQAIAFRQSGKRNA